MTGKFWRAALDTRNFSFETFGATERFACEALRAGLERHVATYRVMDPTQWVDSMIHTAEVREIEFGACYRDGEQI